MHLPLSPAALLSWLPLLAQQPQNDSAKIAGQTLAVILALLFLGLCIAVVILFIVGLCKIGGAKKGKASGGWTATTIICGLLSLPVIFMTITMVAKIRKEVARRDEEKAWLSQPHGLSSPDGSLSVQVKGEWKALSLPNERSLMNYEKADTHSNLLVQWLPKEGFKASIGELDKKLLEGYSGPEVNARDVKTSNAKVGVYDALFHEFDGTASHGRAAFYQYALVDTPKAYYVVMIVIPAQYKEAERQEMHEVISSFRIAAAES